MDLGRLIVGKTDFSGISITDRSIEIVPNNREHLLGVVSIMRGIQIELDRDIMQFLGCLRKIRRPIGIQEIARSGEVATYRLIRLETGDVGEKVVCTFSVVGGLIKVVSFNLALCTDENYKKHEGLSAIHQITAGKCGDSHNLSKALSAVSFITKKRLDELRVKTNSKKTTIYAYDSVVDKTYRYLFVKDKVGYLHLASIAVVAKGVSMDNG